MLDVSGLHAGYGAIPVLHDISLQIAQGESVGILGHNGMGKTTMLRTLIGALRATSGTVRFGDADVTRLAPHARARLGMAYVPQGREIFARLTVEENLLKGLATHSGKKAHTIKGEVYELFPVLKEMLHRRGGDLSGGQQQQLAIARALLAEPKLIILDEPTEGIQPSIIKDIGNVIRLLRQRGDMAILLCEQYFDFAHELADQFMVLSRGEVVASGAQAVMNDPEVKRHLAV